MKFNLIGAAAFLAVLAPAASAQEVGQVSKVSGEVLVARGSETVTLGPGDLIFEGDRIFTRPGGAIDISTSACSRNIGAEASILVDAEFCTKPLTTLAQGEQVLQNAGGAAGGAGGVGTGTIVGGLAAAGGIAAAAAGGGSSSSSSSNPTGGTPTSP